MPSRSLAYLHVNGWIHPWIRPFSWHRQRDDYSLWWGHKESTALASCGYQVCDRWLKDRKEQRLELKDIETYCRMVTAIGKTIEIQKELDTLYPDVEKDLVTIPTE